MRLLEIGRGSSRWHCVGTSFERGCWPVIKTDDIMNRINTAESSNVEKCWKLQVVIFSDTCSFKFPGFGNWRTCTQNEVILDYFWVLIATVESNHADPITAHMVRTCGGRLCCGLFAAYVWQFTDVSDGLSAMSWTDGANRAVAKRG